ncbi:MAG TPA: FkbM family methyltransferase [Gemmataceae bacterium]|nr:FkbM family methyltransferase [Gemmataceae bacterium]
MSNPTPNTPRPAVTPPTEQPAGATPPTAGVSRRDLVFGGVGGLAAGLAVGRWSKATAAAPKNSPWDKATDRSFAQCGEDIIMAWLLTKAPLTLEKPSYLDIGTWEPIVSNNTYVFYVKGGRGVLVEPNGALAEVIRRERPEDKLLTVGIGVDDATEADYWMFNDAQLNTFDKASAEQVMKLDRIKLEKVVKLPLISINRVIAEHMGGKAPDALSIDTEGLDLKILQTLDYEKYRPKLICVETIIATTFHRAPEIPRFLESKGYEVWGQTYANTILLDKTVIPPS